MGEGGKTSLRYRPVTVTSSPSRITILQLYLMCRCQLWIWESRTSVKVFQFLITRTNYDCLHCVSKEIDWRGSYILMISKGWHTFFGHHGEYTSLMFECLAETSMCLMKLQAIIYIKEPKIKIIINFHTPQLPYFRALRRKEFVKSSGISSEIWVKGKNCCHNLH